MLTFFFYLTMTLFILVCVIMVLLVLIQKGRGGGLASAFGGGGGNTAFGSKTGDVLTWATSIVFGVFLLLAIALNLLANKRQADLNAAPMASAPSAPPAQQPNPVQVPAMPGQVPLPSSESAPAPAPAPAPVAVPATRP